MESLKEAAEEIDSMLDIMRSRGFTNRVHGKHWVSNIDGANTGFGKHRSNGGSTRPAIFIQRGDILSLRHSHVVANFEFLNFAALPFDELLDNEGTDCVRSVSLFSVRLDDDSAVHLRTMVVLVFGSVVGMEGMSHVCRDQERARDGLGVGRRRGRKTANQQRDKTGLGPRGRNTANFFVVEERNAVDVAFDRREDIGSDAFHQCFDGAERGDEVIHSGAEDEFVVEASQRRWLNVIKRTR